MTRSWTKCSSGFEKKYTQKFAIARVEIDATGPVDGVVYGYGLDISRCIGCRRCVYACVEENNQSRDPQIHWIRVLEFEREHARARHQPRGRQSLLRSREMVPGRGQVLHSDRVPALRGLPLHERLSDGSHMAEPDGIVVIDYDWCIGCRYCMASCPVRSAPLQLGGADAARRRGQSRTCTCSATGRGPKGVVEKCSFCIQRVRKGRYPACLEACPVGARKFGNHARSEQRDPIPAGAQAHVRSQGRAPRPIRSSSTSTDDRHAGRRNRKKGGEVYGDGEALLELRPSGSHRHRGYAATARTTSDGSGSSRSAIADRASLPTRNQMPPMG